MRLYNNGRLYVKKYNLSVQFLLTSAIQKTQDSSRMPAAINRIGRHPGRQPLGRHRRSGGRQSQRFI